MKLGFNEGCDRFCKDHSVMKDLEYCEKYGFEFIDVQSWCLEKDLEAKKYKLEDLADYFKTHKIKMLSYNALEGFNMKQTTDEKEAVMSKLDEIIRRCNILGCKMIVVVPTQNITYKATRTEIREDAVAVLREMVEKCKPFGIKLSLEFCGCPGMTINRFEDAYAIAEEVDSPFVGLTLDQYHFHAMGSCWQDLEKADGSKIFIWHLNGMEDMPCGAAYNTDEIRLWPGDEGDCLDHGRYARTLKKIGFTGNVCTVEVFRPAYYLLSQEENVRIAAAKTKAHVEKYCR
ncbi:MAG: sugar phosphate isomerase/epimerase [Spirochaetia bacterium]|nr:sugar phosphate isomerase/epimerase [Spirochaetia bacterium]